MIHTLCPCMVRTSLHQIEEDNVCQKQYALMSYKIK